MEGEKYHDNFHMLNVISFFYIVMEEKNIQQKNNDDDGKWINFLFFVTAGN